MDKQWVRSFPHFIPWSWVYTVKDQGCFNWAWFTQLQLETICTLICYFMQLESGLDWDHGTPCLDSSNVPACYQSKSYNVHTMCLLNTKVSLKNLPCVCLLPKCLLRAYNMSTSFTYERPLECLSLTVSHQTSPWLSTKCFLHSFCVNNYPVSCF